MSYERTKKSTTAIRVTLVSSGEILGEFKSMTEAAKVLGINYSTLRGAKNRPPKKPTYIVEEIKYTFHPSQVDNSTEWFEFNENGYTYFVAKDKDSVYSENGVELAVNLSKRGYLTVCIHGVGTKTIHRLKAIAFIPNPNDYPDVDHVNQDKTDNRLENLRWASKEVNMSNTGRNVYVNIYEDGKLIVSNQTTAEACRQLGIANRHALNSALNKGREFYGNYIIEKLN